jgi:hypothetical protein
MEIPHNDNNNTDNNTNTSNYNKNNTDNKEYISPVYYLMRCFTKPLSMNDNR